MFGSFVLFERQQRQNEEKSLPNIEDIFRALVMMRRARSPPSPVRVALATNYPLQLGKARNKILVSPDGVNLIPSRPEWEHTFITPLGRTYYLPSVANYPRLHSDQLCGVH